MDLHTATVPVFTRVLNAMLHWLDKAEAHAEARKFSPDQYLSLKLAPDMLALTKQVQIASDAVKACCARLAGQDVPSWPDDEATFADLRARIRRTLDHVRGYETSAFADAAARRIRVPRRHGEPLEFSADDYVAHYATPNLYFHATTLYALLRAAGVDLGKADFLGAVPA